jgi:hypothetical protein
MEQPCVLENMHVARVMQIVERTTLMHEGLKQGLHRVLYSSSIPPLFLLYSSSIPPLFLLYSSSIPPLFILNVKDDTDPFAVPCCIHAV